MEAQAVIPWYGDPVHQLPEQSSEHPKAAWKEKGARQARPAPAGPAVLPALRRPAEAYLRDGRNLRWEAGISRRDTLEDQADYLLRLLRFLQPPVDGVGQADNFTGGYPLS